MRYSKFISNDSKFLQDIKNYTFNVKFNDSFSISADDYCAALKSHSIKPVFKLFSLWEDEVIRADLTPYLLSDGELTISYENGVRSKLSVSLLNTESDWKINPSNNFLWKGEKFKFFIGFKTAETEYIYPAGVFILNEFSMSHQYKTNVYSLELVDKFGGLDGTVGGKTIDSVYVPVGSNIFQMTKELLDIEKITGVCYDSKTIHFPSAQIEQKTPYTINQSSNSDDNIGAIIKTFATILNCDVYYDRYGHLTFEESPDNSLVNSKPTVWRFTSDDINFISPTIEANLQNVYNVIKVEGGNINGAVMDYTAKNTNPKSPTNITVFEPTPYKITDENIASEDLAKKRAEYELYKRSLLPLSISFNSILIPHLDVNQVIEIFDPQKQLYNTRFIINSISIPISQNSAMTINATNIEEVAFNE